VSERWPATLTREQAMEYLNVGETLFKSLVASGQIRPVRIKSLIRYRRTDLDQFVAELEEGKGEFRNRKVTV
jgi:excisionase family DNA binding protein